MRMNSQKRKGNSMEDADNIELRHRAKRRLLPIYLITNGVYLRLSKQEDGVTLIDVPQIMFFAAGILLAYCIYLVRKIV